MDSMMILKFCYPLPKGNILRFQQKLRVYLAISIILHLPNPHLQKMMYKLSCDIWNLKHVETNKTCGEEELHTRELSYPTWGKGTSSSKLPWLGISWFPVGYIYIYQISNVDLKTQTNMWGEQLEHSQHDNCFTFSQAHVHSMSGAFINLLIWQTKNHHPCR